MAELSGKGRFLKLTAEERNLLIAFADEIQIGDIRVSKWENYGKSRLYVVVDGDKSFIDLSDALDLELGFRDFSSGPAILALLEKLATQHAEEIVEVADEIEATDIPAPTKEQVEALNPEYISSKPAESPIIRILEFKCAWQQLVVTPLFRALPIEKQNPYHWNEICLTLDAEWAEIEQGVKSGLVEWEDHLTAFKMHRALRAS